MLTIKKVQVVPLDENYGKIIDSFNTQDDKTKNAPSLNAVENYVDTEISGAVTDLETVQTFTETVTDSGSGNTGVQITTLWKRVGNVINLMLDVYIPANKSALINVSRFSFTIPEWAKPTSTSQFLIYNSTTNKILGRVYESTDDNKVAIDLITNTSNGLILVGSCSNTNASSDTYKYGTITYILD